MGEYRRLDQYERYQIEVLKERGSSCRETADLLGRSPSTISRELRRNGSDAYRARSAQRRALARRSKIGPPRVVVGENERIVRKHLKLDWSPDQICGRLGVASPETIYQYIDRDTKSGGKLWKHLRRKRRKRWPRQSLRRIKEGRKNKQNDRIYIDQRPEIVEARKRIGDYERDTILDQNKAGLLTIVERKTRFVWMAPFKRVNADVVHKLTIQALKGLPKHTLTNDNGTEFNNAKRTSEALKVPIYYTRPFSSWEKGTNENMNGLIRSYFPKRSPLRGLTYRQVKTVQNLLNNRPRKILGYKTPAEVWMASIGRCAEF